ncbi:hypothetical protein SADUNF_Sadunf14G0049900 [Salix dunnii]|uniref:Uncharacterized protein n=1 Tax=Salix dunnii TaxID=1413687 RepID=A0A835MKA1_9ROSI|nr:hypothetical protein SADUNF_Sadunf14G0049900 [Salix dunnii]
MAHVSVTKGKDPKDTDNEGHVFSFQSIVPLDRTTEPPRSRDKRPLCIQCKKGNGPSWTPLPLRDPRPRHMMDRS